MISKMFVLISAYVTFATGDGTEEQKIPFIKKVKALVSILLINSLNSMAFRRFTRNGNKPCNTETGDDITGSLKP
jgi:hypothetical protein